MTEKPYAERLIGTERYQRWSQNPNYLSRVDMTSSLVFFHVVNGANEFFAGNDWDEVLAKRLVGTALNIATYKKLNQYVDWMRRKFGSKKEGDLRCWLADGASVETFGTTMYALVQFAISRDPKEALTATKRFAGYIAFAGFPYGWVRDRFRDICGVKPPKREDENRVENLYSDDV